MGTKLWTVTTYVAGELNVPVHLDETAAYAALNEAKDTFEAQDECFRALKEAQLVEGEHELDHVWTVSTLYRGMLATCAHATKEAARDDYAYARETYGNEIMDDMILLKEHSAPTPLIAGKQSF